MNRDFWKELNQETLPFTEWDAYCRLYFSKNWKTIFSNETLTQRIHFIMKCYVFWVITSRKKKKIADAILKNNREQCDLIVIWFQNENNVSTLSAQERSSYAESFGLFLLVIVVSAWVLLFFVVVFFFPLSIFKSRKQKLKLQPYYHS